MTDIVDRLRERHNSLYAFSEIPSCITEAADEIEGLRSALSNAGLIIESLRQQLADCERERDSLLGAYSEARATMFSPATNADLRKQLDTVTSERDELVAALPDLAPVITWLENGCNLPDAIAELKLYQDALAKLGADKTGEK